jgi:hypothetical protein
MMEDLKEGKVISSLARPFFIVKLTLLEYSNTEVPFNAYPYLCVSSDILLTPGTWKSKSGILYPSFLANGRMNPPDDDDVYLDKL